MTSRTALPTHPFRAPERALPAKTRLDEFEIETVLAQSSFSIVYRAYDHVLKLHVAIKEYLPDALALRSAETQVVLRARSHAERFEQGLQAFVAEAQTLARCEHPSLQRISRLLLRHGTAYRVMRYSPGPTLAEHRRELGATPAAASVRSWLDALLGALEALHEEGCVHGAVTPGNILLLPGDRPLLLDFDAVRAALISDRTQSMMTALEPCYEPPEQRVPSADRATGPWTDLYALAATLHFCISAQLPPPPDGRGHRFEPLAVVWRRLAQAQPGLGVAPPWLDALDACVQEDPRSRPQNAAELRVRLGAPLRTSSAAPRAAPPPVVPVLNVERDAVPPPPPAAKAASAPRAAGPSASSAAAHAGPVTPPDSAEAKVLADLDKTLAFIAAQATEEAQPDAAATPQVGAPPADEAAADSAAPAGAAVARPLTQRQLLMAGGAVLALLVAMAAVMGWMFQQGQPGLIGAAAPATQPAAAPAGTGGPTDDATTRALQAAEAALNKAPPRAGPPVPPVPADAAPDAPAPPAPPAPAHPVKPRGPATPREACGERAHFALYQCLQTQCDKRAWKKHAQCVQFRKEQKL